MLVEEKRQMEPNKHQGDSDKRGDDQKKKTLDERRNEVEKAHEQADRDIANDPDFNASSPNDDLDEGESARLGENNTGLV